jgi:AcrR family transcriptional regulator
VKTRQYRQTARAASTSATRSAILDATDALFLPRPDGVFSLQEVAERAGTTVQTVLRHFGSKDGLLRAAMERAMGEVRQARDDVPVGDLGAVAAYLAQHYDEVGDMVLRLLAAEAQTPAAAAMNDEGRRMHLAWVERVLEPLVGDRRGAARRERVALLVGVTDLLLWKVLRREQGMSREQYAAAVQELLEGIRP